jgi:hypothetical protein
MDLTIHVKEDCIMIKKTLAWYLIVAMFIIGIAPRLDAAFAPSEVIGLDTSIRTGDIEKIRTALEHKLVQQRLTDLGYTAEEIGTRLTDLTDQELHTIASKLDSLTVGGDGLGIVIAILVIIILVIVVLQLTGRKVVVTQ